MSERDDATGQFVPVEPEPLTGLAGVEEAAGYVPLPDAMLTGETPIEETPLTVEEAVEEMAAAPVDPGTSEYDIVTHSPIDAFLESLPENTTLTLEQAAKLTSDAKAKEAEALEAAEQAKIRDEVDRLRGQADPEANAIDTVEGLEAETRKALKIPQVRAAIEAEFSEANQVREQFTATVQAGQQMLQASLAALAPQLQNVPIEHWGQAIQQLAQTDPARAQLVADTLDKWGRLQFAQQQDQEQRSHTAKQQFETSVRSEDQRLIQMLGSEKTAEEANVALFAYLDAHGVTRDQRLNVLVNNPVLRTAEAREAVWKAAKYDALMKAKPVATRHVAPVVRPGTSNVSRNTDSSAKVRSLERALENATGDSAVRIAAQLRTLERNAS